MSVFQLGDILAERALEARDAAGQTEPVRLVLGIPQLHEDGTWICLRRIIGIGDENVRPGYGADALQALVLSLRMARVELEVLGKRERKTITWFGGEDLELA